MILKSGITYNETASPEELAVLSKAVYLKTVEDETIKYNYDKNKGFATVQALDEWRGDKVITDQSVCAKLSNWEVITDIKDTKGGLYSTRSGMQAVAYRNNKTGEIAIAYRGTDSGLDFANSDAPIFFEATPMQLKAAQNFYKNVKDAYPEAEITLTGHSLGGGLAQVVASENGLSAATFNAPGMQTENGETSDRIVNYVNMNDPVGSYREHIGETRYFLPDGMYGKDEDMKFAPHSDFYNHDFSKYQPLKSGITWDHNDAAAIHGYDVRNNNKVLKAVFSVHAKPENLAPALDKLERSGVNTGIKGVVNYKAGGKLYSLEGENGKIVNCSYPKGKAPASSEETPAVHKKSKGEPTGGAAPVKPEGCKKSSGVGKSDEDGHWITTKNGNKVFIEDEAVFSFSLDPKGMAYSNELYGNPDSQPQQAQIEERPRECCNAWYEAMDPFTAVDKNGFPLVFYSNVSPEVLEVRNDPAMIAYLSRGKDVNGR